MKYSSLKKILSQHLILMCGIMGVTLGGFVFAQEGNQADVDASVSGKVVIDYDLPQGQNNQNSGDVKIDYCPDGDRSGNLYDGTCDSRTPALPVFNNQFDKTQCFQRQETQIIDQGNGMSDHFKSALQLLYAYGLTQYNGTLDFRPQDNITREEAAKFFVQFAKNILCRTPHLTYADNFSDIAGANPTLLPFIKESYEFGIFKGDLVGTFRPHAIISKDELMAVMVRLILRSYLPEPATTDRAVHYRDVSHNLIGRTLIHTKRAAVADYVFDLYHQSYDYYPYGYVLSGSTSIIASY